MSYRQSEFNKKFIRSKNILIKYYTSPLLDNYEIPHAYFTKTESEVDLSLLKSNFCSDNLNYHIKQIHSNYIVFASTLYMKNITEADGIISDKSNQNLWIYTGDCMPVFFADITSKRVAAIHCGRKGLEKKILNKLIQTFKNLGCKSKELLVSIGPSISKVHYKLDKKTTINFYENLYLTDNFADKSSYQISIPFQELEDDKIFKVDLKKHAYFQLINQNIPSSNIDISNKCTFISKNEFHSYRRSKTNSRQWNFISTFNN